MGEGCALLPVIMQGPSLLEPLPSFTCAFCVGSKGFLGYKLSAKIGTVYGKLGQLVSCFQGFPED